VLGLETRGFSDESTMVQDFLQTKEKVLSGVVFNQMPPVSSRTSLSSIEYKLRFPSTLRSTKTTFSLSSFKLQDEWMTRFMFPVVQKVGPRGNSTQGGPPGG